MRVTKPFISLITILAFMAGFAPIKTFAIPLPSDPTSLTQQEGESGATQSAGWMSRLGDAIYFKAHMTTSGPDVSLEVETKLVGTAFTGSGTEISPAVANGMTAIVPSSVSANGNYHWRARERYAGGGATSDWISFGGNAESVADFTIDTIAPTAPTGVTRATPATDATPTFSWTAATDANGIASYAVNLDGAGWATIANGTTTTWTLSGTGDEPPLAPGSHTIQVRATDTARNVSAAVSLTFTISSAPPPIPTGVTRTTPDADSTPTFTWNASTGATAYEIYMTFHPSTGTIFVFPVTNIGSVLTWTVPDASALPAGSYSFAVRAKDASGNASGFFGIPFTIVSSASGGTATADTTPPTVPTGVMRTSPETDTTPTFTWNPSTDNVGVTAYHVQIDGGAFIGLGDRTNYTTLELMTGSHTIGVRAGDGAGNTSGVTVLSFTVVAAGGTGTTTGGGGGGGASTIVAEVSGPPFALEQMNSDAGIVSQGNVAVLLSALQYASVAVCQMDQVTASARVNKVFGMIDDSVVQSAIINFTACGTISTLHLGAGERLGVVNSYKSAFGRLPFTTAHWFDVIKISNGRFPGETSALAEAAAKARFKKIYLRDPNMSQQNDSAAINVMAYGLRPLPRNLNSEAAAIKIYKKIFGTTPLTATQWDALRAIAYSGAVR